MARTKKDSFPRLGFVFDMPENFYWDHSPGKGRGLFANADLKPGDLILEAPLLRMSPGDMHFIESTLLQYYVFGSPDEYSPYSYMALGNAALLNHSDSPNATYLVDEEDLVVRVVAVHPILQKSEILINYNWGSDEEEFGE